MAKAKRQRRDTVRRGSLDDEASRLLDRLNDLAADQHDVPRDDTPVPAQVVVGANGRALLVAWTARTEIVERLRWFGGLIGAEDAAIRFEAVGASRPVLLDAQAKQALLTVLTG